MMKILAVALLWSYAAVAALPPTTSKGIGDTSPKTTFNFEFPNFGITHAGTKATLGTLSILGGGTGATTQQSAINALTGTQSLGKYLRSDGTNATLATLLSSDLSGTVAIANGGTGQATKTAGFNALSPLTAKGSTVGFDGTNNVEVTACADGYQRVFDSTAANGFKCQLGNISLATNWVTVTSPVIGATTTAPTKGTVVTDSYQYRRVGDSMELRYTFAQSAGGSAGSGTYLFPIPLNLTADTSKITITTNATGAGGTVLGTGEIANTTTANAANAGTLQVIAYSSSQLAAYWSYSSGTQTILPVGSAYGGNLGGVSYISFTATIPISQWSQSTTANIYDSGDFSGSTAASVITGTTTNPTKGTTTVDTVTYGRRGKNLNIHWDYVQTAAGSAGSGIYLLALPGGLASDGRANTVSGGTYCSGTLSNNSNGVSNSSLHIEGYLYDSTHLAFKILASAVSGTQNFSTFGSAAYGFDATNTLVSIDCANIPISTWSTFPVGVAVASQEVSAQATVSSSIAVTASSPILFTSTSFDNLGVYTPANGRWTIPANAPGRYEMSCNGFVGISATLFLLKNGTRVNAMFDSSTTARNAGMASAAAAGGDYFTVTSDASGTFAYSSGNYAPACTLKKIN